MPVRASHRPRRDRSVRLLAVLAALVVGSGFGVLRALHAHGTDEPYALHYRIDFSRADEQVLGVRLEVSTPERAFFLGYSGHSAEPTAPSRRFRLRVARDANGTDLAIGADSDAWRIPAGEGPVVLEYEVRLVASDADEPYAREILSQLDADGARLLGSDVFVFPIEHDVARITVDYELPDGWTLHHPFAIGPDRAEIPALRSLYTSAVAVGRYRHAIRDVDGVRIEVALRGHYAFGDHDLIDVIERIVRHQVEFFEGAPRDRYLFVINEHPRHDDPELLHYFGLHFDASMVVLIDPRTDRTRLHAEPASLCAHEFFHNWLGEQVRQDDYAMNWFVEGVTTLYAYRTRLATGMLDPGRYASDVERRYREQWRDEPLRRSMTLDEAGRTVLADPRITRMMYTGGLLAGIALDEHVRRASRGAASLDDVLLDLVVQARLRPDFRLTPETLREAVHARAGVDPDPWLQTTVYGYQDFGLPRYVTGR